MPLAFPDDLNVYDKDLQFMFGPWLLAAPVYDTRDERRVYLPRGRWIDYWSGQVCEGPDNLNVRAPLDTLPLFVRAGAILPHMSPSPCIPAGLVDPLILDLYPYGQSTYRLYEDESVTDFTCARDETGITCDWIGGAERTLVFRFLRAGPPKRVVLAHLHEEGALHADWDLSGEGTVTVRVVGRSSGQVKVEV
jgi:hypothetical protein